MDNPSRFRSLAAAARDRTGCIALIQALGFEPCAESVPRGAWAAYGLTHPEHVTRLTVAGRAGSLDALLIELPDHDGFARVGALAGGIRARNPLRLHLYVFVAPGRLCLGTYGVEGEFLHLTMEPDRLRATDLDALDEMARRDGEEGLALALRHERALDRSRVTHLFFRDFRAQREAVARAFTGLPERSEEDRSRLAILFLCRLTFLYFLQRRGVLGGDDRYMVRLLGEWAGEGGGRKVEGTFYRRRLGPLFFGALNRPREDRCPAAAALGELPYLNGGLFEPHPLELRHPGLDLPDAVIRSVVHDLLERYRFTSREAGAGAGYGVDPEVLGRVFEGLMAPEERGRTGSFYTPAPVVARVVREAVGEYLAGACPEVDAEKVLDAAAGAVHLTAGARKQVARSLERVRVLDPACGSGAFLLGALHRIAGTLAAVSGQGNATVRREVVARSLHGVDLLDDAALLCSLRLWLALSEADDVVRPLPNLDRRIRQGDALIDPLDLAGTGIGTRARFRTILGDPDLRRAYRAVAPAARRYLGSSPTTRGAARAELARAEQRLAGRWIARLQALHHDRILGLRAEAEDRDLFGDVPETARRARVELKRAAERTTEIDEIARQLDERGALPFFSFGVHFAESGGAFDLIISNPPWVRAHRWPDRLRQVAARHYEICRGPAWTGVPGRDGGSPAARGPVGAGAQLDLSLLFVERCCRLLAPGGVLAILLPAKAMRALYGGSTRRMLLRDLEFSLIEDHSLDHRSIFRADAFVAVLVARRPAVAVESATPAKLLRIRMVRRGAPPLEFRTRTAELPLFPSDPASPWVIAPPDVVGVLRCMQAVGPPLGAHAGLVVRRGVMTGANDVLIMRGMTPRLGGLARVEAVGYEAARRSGLPARQAGRFRAYVETAAIRPMVRGAGIDSFRYAIGGHLVWCHDEQGAPRHPPPRMARYLARHQETLESRPGWRAGLPPGVVFRVSSDTVRPKVAWHDLSDTVRAVALPARVPVDGIERTLIPLNTVYFLPVDERREALLLAGMLNALPVRVFARSIAERAKDARFRFFAWTMVCLPLPVGWRHDPVASEILRISREAHDAGGLGPDGQTRLDAAVGTLYGLDGAQLDTLRDFDRWLRGEP